MPFCSRCSQQLPEGSRFCAHCGSSAIPAPDEKDESQPAASAAGITRQPQQRSSTISFWKILGAVALVLIVGAFLRGMFGEMNVVDSQSQNGDAETSQAAPVPVAHPAPRKPHVVFETSGSGMKSTQRFTVPDEWALVWSYDCSNFGQSGNFMVDAKGSESGLQPIANELGPRGHDISYLHSGGSIYLEVNSECDWRVRVLTQ
jgi:hypothetical protein